MDTEKSVVGTIVDTVTTMGEAVKSAVMPIRDTEAEAAQTNQQMLAGDAAIAPEALPSPVVRKKRAAPPKRAKRVAKKAAAKKAPTKKAAKKSKAKSAAKKAKKSSPKKTTKKTSKKAAKKKKKAKRG